MSPPRFWRFQYLTGPEVWHPPAEPAVHRRRGRLPRIHVCGRARRPSSCGDDQPSPDVAADHARASPVVLSFATKTGTLRRSATGAPRTRGWRSVGLPAGSAGSSSSRVVSAGGVRSATHTVRAFRWQREHRWRDDQVACRCEPVLAVNLFPEHDLRLDEASRSSLRTVSAAVRAAADRSRRIGEIRSCLPCAGIGGSPKTAADARLNMRLRTRARSVRDGDRDRRVVDPSARSRCQRSAARRTRCGDGGEQSRSHVVHVIRTRVAPDVRMRDLFVQVIGERIRAVR